MNPVQSLSIADDKVSTEDSIKVRLASESRDPGVLADIYRDNVNIAVWRRDLSDDLRQSVSDFADKNPRFSSSMTVSPVSALASISEALGGDDQCRLSHSIATLVEMYCDLLGVKRAGLRFGALSSAMCPKFHVDRVPCRLVTTYHGAGTEWIPHSAVDRSKLGRGSRGKPDHESGLYSTKGDIRQLACGDVALLKGELWDGNEDAGLVHRSPDVASGDVRLLLSLDVSG